MKLALLMSAALLCAGVASAASAPTTNGSTIVILDGIHLPAFLPFLSVLF